LIPGNLPCALSDDVAERLSSQVKALFAAPIPLEVIRPLAIGLYSEICPSVLVSPQFDLGTHEPRRANLHRETRGAGGLEEE
jgi:hypothetical protein